MPPEGSYEGETCVAYLDISGFKEIMNRENRAARILDKFYKTLFIKVRRFKERPEETRARGKVRSIVVSDCAVIFVDNKGLLEDQMRDLGVILDFVQQVNRDLIRGSDTQIMTMCTVAFGRFKYVKKFEFEEISKEYFVGWPYVKAFLDCENGEPRIQPGQCRILKENLNPHRSISNYSNLSLLEETGKYYYFYWMLDDPTDIEPFKEEYKNAHQALYSRLVDLLQDPSAILRNRIRGTG